MSDPKAICVTALRAGTYRVMDGRLYRVEPGLPPSLDTRDAEIATLRTRAEQAEAERDALGRSLDASASTVALLSAQVGRAEAEVARLRAERDDVSIHAAGRLVREAREAALREAAGVCEAYGEKWGGDRADMGWTADECRKRILALLDASPAREVSDG